MIDTLMATGLLSEQLSLKSRLGLDPMHQNVVLRQVLRSSEPLILTSLLITCEAVTTAVGL